MPSKPTIPLLSPSQLCFIRLDHLIPDILIELKYASRDNFMGAVVDGYAHACALLSRPAAEALARVAAELRQQDLRVKIFDAYRPQRASTIFYAGPAARKIYGPKHAFTLHWKSRNCLSRAICSATLRIRAAAPSI